MATAGGGQRLNPNEAKSVAQFVFDVMRYTLPRCGFAIPMVTRDSPDITYERSNFLKTVGVSTLRLCMVMRDTWRETFRSLSLKRDALYDINYFGGFCSVILKMAAEEGDKALQPNIELSLALCNEMALFIYFENLRFNFTDLVAATAGNIIALFVTPQQLTRIPRARHPKFLAEIQKLFPELGNVWELSKWLEDFAREYAIPYVIRKEVTKFFYREVKKRWMLILEKDNIQEPSIEEVKINLGFLPKEVYENIVSESPVPMPPYPKVAWVLLLKGSKTSEPAKPSASSKKGGVRGRRRATGSSGQAATGGQTSKDSSKQAATGGQTSKDNSKQGATGGLTSKDSSEQAATGGLTSKDSSKQAATGGQTSKDSSKQAATGGQTSKDSSKQATTGGQTSKDSSKQGATGGQSSKDSSEQAAEGVVTLEMVQEELKLLNLDEKGNSQASKGAIPKRKRSKKKK